MNVARDTYAGASANNATVAQLSNSSWAGIFDGVHAGCGVSITTTAAGAPQLTLDDKKFAECAALKKAVLAGGGEFHVWTNAVPQACDTRTNLTPCPPGPEVPIELG